MNDCHARQVLKAMFVASERTFPVAWAFINNGK